MQRAVRYAALGLVLLAAACDDTISNAPAPEPAPTVQSDLSLVARAVALGLKDESARLAVRDGLRDSPWIEHKVVFQEFLKTEGGQSLLQAAAGAAGLGVDALQARIAGLPELDFFVPSREQRLAWRGTPDVAVGATLELDGKVTVAGFDAQGGKLADVTASGAGAVFLLTPSEIHFERLEPQPRGVGATIQAPNDGEQADGLYTWTNPDGTSITRKYSELLKGEDPRFQAIHYSSGTRLEDLAGFMQDGGSNYLELGVRAFFYAPDGTFMGSGSYKGVNNPYNSTFYPRVTLFSFVIPDNGTARIRAELWELDNCNNFCQDDNRYGYRDWYWGDRDVTYTITCDQAGSGGVCTQGGTVGNIKLHWHAVSASVFTSARIVPNPVTILEQGYEYVTAQALDQYNLPISGYTASNWTTGNSLIASVSSVSGNTATLFGNSPGYTTVSATVNGSTVSANVTVEADPYGSCYPQLYC